jgi:hypothetical protein
VTSGSHPPGTAWLSSFVAWLTPRRIRAQAVILALCLWGVCAVDFATPGVFDRAGNIKFQDFLPLYTAAKMIANGRAHEIYDEQVVAGSEAEIVGGQTAAQLPFLYGPQMALLVVPLAGFPFLLAASAWAALNAFIYGACVYLILKTCSRLVAYSKNVAIAAAAFPPFFHFFVRGQTSALVLACFTAALLAFRAERGWVAGMALGLLVFKPQFLVAVPLILLLARGWKALLGMLISIAAQLAFAWIYFGSGVMGAYFDVFWHASRWMPTAELSLAPIQMHSLRSFWTLLIPWQHVALALYIGSSIVAIATAAVVWRSTCPLALRFAVLALAAILVNPHLFVYDLLVLVPVLLLVVDWALSEMHGPYSLSLLILSYLAFVLPLLGPLSRWTHVQFTVPVFVALLSILYLQCRRSSLSIFASQS